MKTILTLLLACTIFGFTYADSGNGVGVSGSTKAYVEQDRKGFHRLIDPPFPPSNFLIQNRNSPIQIERISPNYRIAEGIENALVKHGIMNPNVYLTFAMTDTDAKKWLMEELPLATESGLEQQIDLDVKGISWNFPKEYYFHYTPDNIEADIVQIRSWHPFRVDAQIKYSLNGQVYTKTIPQWVTEDMLRGVYDNTSDRPDKQARATRLMIQPTKPEEHHGQNEIPV